MENNTEWICTDSDNEQYGRQIGERLYEFKEKNRGVFGYDEGEIIEITINLDHYTDKQIEEEISSYYSSVEEVKEIYGDSWEWIIAECIFEQESGNY